MAGILQRLRHSADHQILGHMRRILFHRTWPAKNRNVGTAGGQLKMRDAFEHFRTAPGFEPYVHFPEGTVWHDNPGNVWIPYRAKALKTWEVRPGDVFFFAGRDWGEVKQLPRLTPRNPVLAIAQPRHVRPEDIRHGFLQERAIRIAKSEAGKRILEEFGVNGPIFCIPDALDFDLLPAPVNPPAFDLLIVGMKNKPLGRALEAWARETFPQLRVNAHINKVPTRREFLDKMATADVVCFLPVPVEDGLEGFFLPALEAMRMRRLVICPDAIGNRDFCRAGETCLMPSYDLEGFQAAIHEALSLPAETKQRIIENGFKETFKHDIAAERKAYVELISQVDEIWASF